MAHTLKIEGDTLILEFKGLEQVAALKRRLEFKLKNITKVSTEPHKWIEGLRVAGAGLPGVIKEGSYVVSGKRVFFAMRHPEKCVTIEFENEEYDAIVVEVDDRQSVVEQIKSAIS